MSVTAFPSMSVGDMVTAPVAVASSDTSNCSSPLPISGISLTSASALFLLEEREDEDPVNLDTVTREDGLGDSFSLKNRRRKWCCWNQCCCNDPNSPIWSKYHFPHILPTVPTVSTGSDGILMIKYLIKHVHLCSSPSSSFLYALISISRASFTSSSSWYSLSWAFIRSLSSAISCSFASMARRCLSRSDDRISSNSLIRSSEAVTYKSKHADTTQLKPNSKPPEILSCLRDLKCGSCRRGLHLGVLVSIKPHLFLQGAELVSKALYSGTRLLQLLPGWAHCLVINLRGHFGIIQLQTERDR